MNRLAGESSPYLLQHKDNPVDWWPWCPEAFAEAERLDRPVLLSIGYAACHWCHVMAHESFEDPATAELMNRHFINIKVDREEQPDVDAIYMEYVQALTGQGGWPMTTFLTPQGDAFYAGTYFPPQPRHGMPSFPQLLQAIASTWAERRSEAVGAAARISQALTERVSAHDGSPPPDADGLAAALEALATAYDVQRGGFGGAPKFPPSMVLEWLLRHHARTGEAPALTMAAGTFDAMARGGIYDQLAGGFARYSVDDAWVVPHFEKMLYDNALLLRAYLHWWRVSKSPLARRVVEETAEFLLADLRTEQGGFASALDADTDGVEGLTYVWTPVELVDVLGSSDGRWAADLFEVTEEGSFEHGASTLQLLADPEDWPRWRDVRARLAAARARRSQPGRDDKVVAAWNGLAIAALAEAGALLERPEWTGAAIEAAELLVSVHLFSNSGGQRLLRVSKDGAAGRHAGVLEDYADAAEGFLALYSVTGDETWLDRAGRLLDVVIEQFDDGDGGFFDTASDSQTLVRRPKDPTDNATPSGTAAAAGALLTYAALTGSSTHRDAARDAVAVCGRIGVTHPRFAGWGLAVAEALLDGPREIAIVGRSGRADTEALRTVALQAVAPGAALAVGDPHSSPAVPLLKGRPLVDGVAAAYVCRDFACQRPVTTPEELEALLAQLR